MACGTCHDNVFFDTGTLNPPRAFGKPAGRRLHDRRVVRRVRRLRHLRRAVGDVLPQVAPDPDRRCAVQRLPSEGRAGAGRGLGGARGHLGDARSGPGAHQRRRSRGASGPGGSFVAGTDTPTLTFQLVDKTGAVVSTLKTDSTLSGTAILSGPTDDRQRVYGPLTIKTQGTLSYDAAEQHVHLRLPVGVPDDGAAAVERDAGDRRGSTARAPTRCGFTSTRR